MRPRRPSYIFENSDTILTSVFLCSFWLSNNVTSSRQIFGDEFRFTCNPVGPLHLLEMLVYGLYWKTIIVSVTDRSVYRGKVFWIYCKKGGGVSLYQLADFFRNTLMLRGILTPSRLIWSGISSLLLWKLHNRTSTSSMYGVTPLLSGNFNWTLYVLAYLTQPVFTLQVSSR